MNAAEKALAEKGGPTFADLCWKLREARQAEIRAVQHEEARKLAHGQLARDIASRCLKFQAARVEAAAQREYPSVIGSVLPSDLTLDGSTDTPTGYAAISGGWNSDLGSHVSVDECWKRARDQSVPIQIIVGIGREEPIAEDDDGSPLGYTATWNRERFFVPRDSKKAVLPPKQSPSYGGKVLTDEERRAEELERDARLWAARLSIPRFSDIPGFEGRVFYDRDWLDTHLHRPGDPKTGPRTPSFELRVFVTEEEIAANLDAGRTKAADVREQLERFRAEQRAQREAAEHATEERWQTLCAQDPAPEVLLTIDGDLWIKTAEGWTIEGDEQDVGYAEEFADLLDQLSPSAVASWWSTRIDYDASRAEPADEEIAS
jgi:hypothetical protein